MSANVECMFYVWETFWYGLRKTANHKENLFARTIDGNALIDRAYQMVKAA